MAITLYDLLRGLQAQSAPQTAPVQEVPQDIPVSDEGGDITVEAIRRRPQASPRIAYPEAPPRPTLTNGPEAPDLGNRNYLEAARAALTNVPERKGVFGTKGTLRDILGTIGDAFLVQGGADPQYGPRRQRERAMDALAGFTENPIAAAERYGQVDPNEARKFYDSVIDNQTKAEIAKAQIEAYKTQVAKESNDKYEYGARTFGQMAGAATPETYARIAPILKKIKERAGLGDEYLVPDAYDENLMSSYRLGSTPAQQQLTADYRDRSLEQRRELEVMKEAGRNRRDNPPAPRSAPQPTAASIAAPILAKISQGGTPSAGELQVLKRLGMSQDRGSGGGKTKRTIPPLPPGFTR